METILKEMQKHLHESQNVLWSFRHHNDITNRVFKNTLIKDAIGKCKNETVVQWLRENAESDTFCKLVDIFCFLRERIKEEEKKDHSDNVDITFVAHGAIRDSMIPASRLLPLPSISDVLLYSPWNCIMDVKVVYGVATGLMRPQHRVFRARDGGQPPTKLPNIWNSMKKAGDQMIPNILLSPLKPANDVWDGFQSLVKTHGQPERNRIVIPFMPAQSDSSQRVPFYVITLALALVLQSSRFRATVHLAACLGDQSVGRKFDKQYLQDQYACTEDDTLMTASPDMFTISPVSRLIRLFFGPPQRSTALSLLF